MQKFKSAVALVLAKIKSAKKQITSQSRNAVNNAETETAKKQVDVMNELTESFRKDLGCVRIIIHEKICNQQTLRFTMDRLRHELFRRFLSDVSAISIRLMARWRSRGLVGYPEANRCKAEIAAAGLREWNEKNEAEIQAAKADFQQKAKLTDKLDCLVKLLESVSRMCDCAESVNAEVRKTDSLAQESDLDELNEIRELVKKLHSRYAGRTIALVVTGLEKAGKSCFCNAVIGRYLLPTANERCTQMPCAIVPPKKLEDPEELEVPRVTITEGSSVQKFDADEKHLKQLRETISTRGKASRVEVETSLLASAEDLPLTIFDLPGYDSAQAEHKAAVEAELRTCDAFLFLHNIVKPSITAEQVKVLEQLKANFKGANDFAARGFALMTMGETLDPAKRRDCVRTARAELVKYGFDPQRIFEVSFFRDHLEALINDTTAGKEERDMAKEALKNLKESANMKRTKDFLHDSILPYASEAPMAAYDQTCELHTRLTEFVAAHLKKLPTFPKTKLEQEQLLDQTMGVQWASSFEAHLELVKANANVMQYEEFDNNARIEEEFMDAIDDFLASNVNVVPAMRNDIAIQERHLGLANSSDIEARHRLLYFDSLHRDAGELIASLATCMERSLKEMEDALIAGVCPGKEIQLKPYRLPRADLEQQLEGLVMSVLYPVLVCYVKIPAASKERELALGMLRSMGVPPIDEKTACDGIAVDEQASLLDAHVPGCLDAEVDEEPDVANPGQPVPLPDAKTSDVPEVAQPQPAAPQPQAATSDAPAPSPSP